MNAGEDRLNVRHERRDVNARALIGIVAAAVLLAVIGHFTLHAFLNWLAVNQQRSQDAPHPLAVSGIQVPPAPALQVEVAQELQRSRAKEVENLNGYAWVDRPAGRVRIPIERAMMLVVQRAQEGEKNP